MDGLTNIILEILKSIISIGSLGPAGWIAIGSVLIVLTGGGAFFYFWFRKKYNAEIFKKTQERRQQDQASNTRNNQNISDNWNVESDIDSKLRELRGENKQ